MRSFYLAYQVVPQVMAQLEALSVFRILWGPNAILLEREKMLNPRSEAARGSTPHPFFGHELLN